MKENLNLIVMLTHNDKTVKNANEIFDECKNSKATYWGMKEENLPLEKMKQLYKNMKQQNKTTVLEVVTYTEEEGLKGAKRLKKIKLKVMILLVYLLLKIKN